MTRVAEFYGRELNQRIATLAEVVALVMLLVMGVVVGLIVISLILRRYSSCRAPSIRAKASARGRFNMPETASNTREHQGIYPVNLQPPVRYC